MEQPHDSKDKQGFGYGKFDSFCKKVLTNEVRNFHNELNRRLAHEKSLSDLSAQELAQLSTSDEYFATEQIFNVLGQDIIVKNERIAEVLQSLDERRRDIILLFYFLDMNDREIGEKLNLIRATVQYQRSATLKELKKLLGEEDADE